jgi:hypothetical protein
LTRPPSPTTREPRWTPWRPSRLTWPRLLLPPRPPAPPRRPRRR